MWGERVTRDRRVAVMERPPQCLADHVLGTSRFDDAPTRDRGGAS